MPRNLAVMTGATLLIALAVVVVFVFYGCDVGPWADRYEGGKFNMILPNWRNIGLTAGGIIVATALAAVSARRD